SAKEHNGFGSGHEMVVARPAFQDLEAGYGVVADFQPAGVTRDKIDGHALRGGRVVERVAILATVIDVALAIDSGDQMVIPRATVDGVLAISIDENVVPVSPMQFVIAVAAIKDIMPCVAL